MTGPGATPRWPALLALALPVLAGLGWMATQGAPPRYLAINGAAVAAGLALVRFAGPALAPLLRHRRLAMLVLLALFALPLVTGPEAGTVSRWLPLPLGFTLHAGMLVLPLVTVLASTDENDGTIALLAALLVALFQPDGASAAAVTVAAVGLLQAWGGWRMGLVAAVGLLAGVQATLQGELPPQPFVERVIADAALVHPAFAVVLLATQLGGFLLLAYALPGARPARLALAGSLFGFAVMSLMNHYPAPLLGFGAAPIIGYALALAVIRRMPA